MKNFMIVARSFGPTHEKYIKIVEDYIKLSGGNCLVDINPCPDESDEVLKVPENVDCIITVGGDGTVVRVAHNVSNPNIPIVGLNCGHLGYLCDMSIDNVNDCLSVLLSEEIRIEKRMMLEGCLSSKPDLTYKALNDVVISSSSSGIAVLHISVTVNGIKLYSHNCDGLILATPTGSTAYNLSANGPIVSPHSNCIILTPINPHTLNSRSIILSSEDIIEIQVSKRHESDSVSASVIYDGAKRQMLHDNEVLKVYRSKDTTSMVRLESASFLDRIRARMQEI